MLGEGDGDAGFVDLGDGDGGQRDVLVREALERAAGFTGAWHQPEGAGCKGGGRRAVRGRAGGVWGWVALVGGREERVVLGEGCCTRRGGFGCGWVVECVG